MSADSYSHVFNSPLASYETESYVCSNSPNCEWGLECAGIHSYSLHRSEATVDGNLQLEDDDCVDKLGPPQSPGKFVSHANGKSDSSVHDGEPDV